MIYKIQLSTSDPRAFSSRFLAPPTRPVLMTTAPSPLRSLQSLQTCNLAMELGLIAACLCTSRSRDAFGYFLYVLLGFAVLFLSLEITVIRMLAKLQQIGIRVTEVRASKTEKVSEHGHRSKLIQAASLNFTERLFCMIILKFILSVLFMF